MLRLPRLYFAVVKIRQGYSTVACKISENDAQIKELELTRNVGIIAHIDAGKTTTTERFLFYSGLTARLGNVDSGDTVTDYLPQERERGITITSAAITFGWRASNLMSRDKVAAHSTFPIHRINLIDTPGHIDFTMEVEKSLRVMDSAVIILDSVSGVQAQTKTVWEQSKRYSLPCIAFANKMDRIGASFGKTLKSMEESLGIPVIPLQWPVKHDDSISDRNFEIADLVNGQTLRWVDTLGKEMECSVTKDPEMRDRRRNLLERLAEWDDEILDKVISLTEDSDSFDDSKVDAEMIERALRRGVLSRKFVPVLLGASFRNIGVQPLMDAVLKYLPSPLDRPSAVIKFYDPKLGNQTKSLPCDPNGPLILLAFKVMNDLKRNQMLTYVRVYSGTLKPNVTLHNNNRKVKERTGKLYQMYADDLEEIPCVLAGNIGVLMGFKETCTGDTLIQGNAESSMSCWFLNGMKVPPSVFSRSLESSSLSGNGTSLMSRKDKTTQALELIQREDPSCVIQNHPETGQTLISGMGELHLEIILDRLRGKPWGLNSLSLGKIWIAYRETFIFPGSSFYHLLSSSSSGNDGATKSEQSKYKGHGLYVKYELSHSSPQGEYLKGTLAYVIEPLEPRSGLEEGSSQVFSDEPFRNWDDIVSETVSALMHYQGLCRGKPNAKIIQQSILGGDGCLVIPGTALSCEAKELFQGGEKDLLLMKSDPGNTKRHDLSMWNEESFLALVESMLSCLQRGALLGFPLMGLRIRLVGMIPGLFASDFALPNNNNNNVSGGTFLQNPKIIRLSFSRSFDQLVLPACREAGLAAPLEPCMRINITCPKQNSVDLLSDLNKRRRAEILISEEEDPGSLDQGQGQGQINTFSNYLIEAIAPVSTLANYCSWARRLTSGHASVSMEYAGYREMSPTAAKQWIDQGGVLDHE